MMTSHTLKVGDLFTHTADITTRPCIHCGAPAVDSTTGPCISKPPTTAPRPHGRSATPSYVAGERRPAPSQRSQHDPACSV